MRECHMPRLFTASWIVLFFAAPAPAQDAAPVTFEVSIDKAVLAKPFTGRVFVTFTRSEPRPVLRSISWFNPEQTFALDVKDLKPGDSITLGSAAKAYPKAMADISAGRYFAQ